MSTKRDRFFVGIARLGVGRPWNVLAVVLLVLVGFGAAVPGLGVSTSRTGLVSDDDPQQARSNAFLERFGRPEVPLYVVSGGTGEQRRAAVDQLQAALDTDARFQGRVFARLTPEGMAKILLLQDPQALVKLRDALPPGTDLATVVEHGLPAWLGVLQAQLEQGLGGEGAAAGRLPSPDEMTQQFEQLAALAETMRGALTGQFSLGAQVERPGIDEAGYLVTADGQHHLVTVFADLPSDEGVDLLPIIERMRALRDDALVGLDPAVTIDLTGLPALAVDELHLLGVGLRRSSIATTIGIFVLCWILFRSLRQTIVALVPLLPGVVLTLAFVRFVFDDLNLVTSNFVAVLLGLGIDFSVHLVSRRNEEVRAGKDDRAALVEALRATGPGVLAGALVTAVAFLTTTTTDFTAYAELGIITAVGLVVIVAAAFFMIPPLMVIGRGQRVASAAPEFPGLNVVVHIVRRFGVAIFAVSLVAAVAGGFSLRRIDFDARYFNFLPESTESARALMKLEYDPIASPVFAAIPVNSIEEARRVTTALRELDVVAGVQSPSDLLPSLEDGRLTALRAWFAPPMRSPDFAALAALPVDVAAVRQAARGVADSLEEVAFALRQVGGPADAADRARASFAALDAQIGGLDAAGQERLAGFHRAVANLGDAAWSTAQGVAERGAYRIDDLPTAFAKRFVSLDGSAVAVYAVPAGQFWDRDVAHRFAEKVRAVDEGAVGLAMVHVAHGEMILAGFKRASLIAAVLIVVLLVVDFRSLFAALLALLPTAVGWLWMLGALALFGLKFDVANIVALPLVIGIGIAYGVHMMHRVREDQASLGGAMPDLDVVVRGTGGAVVVAALTTMLGFAGLMLGKYGAMWSLGLVMVLGIGASLLATVFLLPVVLLLLRQVR